MNSKSGKVSGLFTKRALLNPIPEYQELTVD